MKVCTFDFIMDYQRLTTIESSRSTEAVPEICEQFSEESMNEI